MKTITFIISAVFILSGPELLYSQATQQADSLTETIVLRPIDHVLNKPDWNFASVDMFTFWLNNGLYGNYGPQPDILLDGIPVDVNFFGWQNLNIIPVYLPNIFKIESNTNLDLYKEEIYPTGMFDFINQIPSKELNLKGTIYFGNESGDPGPWVYDSSRVTPNVDRWGPDIGGVFSISKNNWYERILFIQRKHQQTDPITHRRILRTMREFAGTRGKFYPNQTLSQSGLFETGYKSKTLDFKARIIIAEDQNYLFLQPFAREVPSKAQYQQIVLDANYENDKWRFGLSYILNQKKLKRRNTDHDYIFNWNQDNNIFKGSVAFTSNNFSLKSSINLDQQNTNAPGIVKNHDFVTDILIAADWQKNEEAKFKFIASLDIHGNKSAKTIKIGQSQNLNKNWEIKLDGFFKEMLPIQQESFGFWISRGYNFYKELGLNVNQPVIIRNNRLIHFKLENSFKPAKQLTFSLIQDFTHHYDLNIPWHIVNYNPETGTTPGTFTISQEEGTRISIKGKLNQSPLAWLDHSLSLHFQSTLQGSQRYDEYFQQIPVTKIIYQIGITPVKNLSLSLRGIYRSPTTWTEFEALDGETYRDIDNLFPIFTGTYDSTVPAHLDIEMGARKWFWQKRLSLQMTVKNLLNNKIRMHPMGADQSLMFNIKATAAF